MTNMSSNIADLTLEQIEAAMDAECVQHIGHLTLGMGEATLPSAKDGAPVSVSAAQALEAIQRFGGACWVDEGGALVGWSEDGPDDGPDDAWTIQRVQEAMQAEKFIRVGLMILGGGAARVYRADGGECVWLTARQALEALQRARGWCWATSRGELVGLHAEEPTRFVKTAGGQFIQVVRDEFGDDVVLLPDVLDGGVREILFVDAVARALAACDHEPRFDIDRGIV